MAEAYQTGDPLRDALIASLFGAEVLGDVRCSECGAMVKFSDAYMLPGSPPRYLCGQCAMKLAEKGET